VLKLYAASVVVGTMSALVIVSLTAHCISLELKRIEQRVNIDIR